MSLVSFTLELKDMMSGGIQKVAATTHSAFKGIDEAVKGTKRYMDKLSEETKIHVNTNELEHAHEKVKELTSAWEVMRGTMAGEFAFRMGERAFEFAKDFLTESVHLGMEEQQTKMRMLVMKGDKEGMELYEQVHSNLLKSLYGTQLYRGATALTSSGMSSEAVMEKLHQFEDIAGGSAQGFDQLIESYMMARGHGSFTLQQLTPLARLGFDPTVELMRAHGHSQAFWHEQLEDPKTAMKRFEEAINLATEAGGKFAGMQEKLLGTDYGKIVEAQTNWENTKAEFGVEILPAVVEVLNALKPSLEKLPEKLHEMVPHLMELGKDIAHLIEWVVKNTDTIEEWVKVGWKLIEAMTLLKTVEIAIATKNAFTAGLTGVETAGGMSLMGGMGAGAAGMEAIGLSVAGLLTGTAVIAAIAYVAYEMWDAYSHSAERMAYDAAHPTVYRGSNLGYSVSQLPQSGGLQGNVPGWLNGDFDENGQPVNKNGKDWRWINGKLVDMSPKTGDDGLKDATDAITGSGPRQVNITVKSFVEHWEQHVGSHEEGAREAQPIYEHMMAEVLLSAAETI